MNRRHLLKSLIAAPFAGLAALLAPKKPSTLGGISRNMPIGWRNYVATYDCAGVPPRLVKRIRTARERLMREQAADLERNFWGPPTMTGYWFRKHA